MVARDSVAITGSAIGVSSLFLGWLTVKSSRVAAGESLSLPESYGWAAATARIFLWLVCLALSLTAGGKRRAAGLGITANIILFLSFFWAGLAAGSILEAEPEFSRVSLSAGIWINFFAVYVVIFASRQGLGDSSLWRNIVSWAGLISVGGLLFGGWLHDISVIQEFIGREGRFQQELLQHIFLFGGSVALATVIGVPLGIWAVKNIHVEKPIFYLANITQTIPSLALFGLLIAPLSVLSFSFPILRQFGIRGVGVTPAMIALVIYSLLPIIRNTYVGLRQLDPGVIDAGLGMGMNRMQVFRRVEMPLAAPLVLEGVRTASVQAIGLATVAALIGAGGLGWFVFQGLGQAAADLIVLGAIPIIILAVAIDALMRLAVRAATPRGL